MTETQQTLDEDLDGLVAEAGKLGYHTILEVWTELLKPAESERSKPIAPQWASKMLGLHAGLTFQDMGELRDRYFDKIIDLRDLLAAVVSEDDEAFNRISAEEDATLNRHHYLTVLFGWQQRILLWELEWDWAAPSAATELAAISEVHKMFFADQGITALLDQIGFQFDDEDRSALVAMLEDTRALVQEVQE